MSGDLRAKKNTRILNKTARGNNLEKGKKASQFQQSDSQEEYEGDHGMKDFNNKGDVLKGKDDDYEEEEDHRVIKTKQVRKTKRRELNKQKQQGRPHRQQTPPPPRHYAEEEDTASDEYDEYRNENRKWDEGDNRNICGKSSICGVLGGLVLLFAMVGLCAIVIGNDDYKKIISNSESVKILAANIVFPDFQDIQNRLDAESVKATLTFLKDVLGKVWESVYFNINQFSTSTKETCSNIFDFINTIIVEIKSGDVFKDESKTQPLTPSTNPNDDSEDYTAELNNWIESKDIPKITPEMNENADPKLVENEFSNKQRGGIEVTNLVEETQIDKKTIIAEKDNIETKLEPSIAVNQVFAPDSIADTNDPSIKVTSTFAPKATTKLDEDGYEPIIN